MLTVYRVEINGLGVAQTGTRTRRHGDIFFLCVSPPRQCIDYGDRCD
ncbi:hypothetical protein [Nostoc sp. DedQUE04]|nr:hypothetical protein [Nostoc sp. DedQUE04]